MKKRLLGGLCFFAIVLFIVTFWMPFGATQEVRRPLSAVEKIPEEYVENPKLLLEDYRNHRIRLEAVIQILILRSIENDGMFLPLDETDTFMDFYFVDRGRHLKVERMRSIRQEYKK